MNKLHNVNMGLRRGKKSDRRNQRSNSWCWKFLITKRYHVSTQNLSRYHRERWSLYQIVKNRHQMRKHLVGNLAQRQRACSRLSTFFDFCRFYSQFLLSSLCTYLLGVILIDVYGKWHIFFFFFFTTVAITQCH